MNIVSVHGKYVCGKNISMSLFLPNDFILTLEIRRNVKINNRKFLNTISSSQEVSYMTSKTIINAQSSGILRRNIHLKSTEVSEEIIASIFRVEE
jgi:hypothetical protein